MSSWVISSNPKSYAAKRSFEDNGEVDWVTKSDFEVGDVVYIYEVIPPRGRGGIVYKTEVTMTGLTLTDKLVDHEYWAGQTYPENITERTKFSRLRLVAETRGNGLSFDALKEYGFTPPQTGASLLDKKPSLLRYVQSHF